MKYLEEYLDRYFQSHARMHALACPQIELPHRLRIRAHALTRPLRNDCAIQIHRQKSFRDPHVTCAYVPVAQGFFLRL
jgi:hypothetical protein